MSAPTAVPTLIRFTPEALADAAFADQLPTLARYLQDTHGYVWDGQHSPANGATLGEFRAWTAALSLPLLATLTADDLQTAWHRAQTAADSAGDACTTGPADAATWEAWWTAGAQADALWETYCCAVAARRSPTAPAGPAAPLHCSTVGGPDHLSQELHA